MTIKASVATVKLGTIEFDGLLLSDGSFGISVPQANQLLVFSPSNNTASRDLKRILGEGFSPSKVKIENVKQLINSIPLLDFESVVFELSLKGHQKAIAFSRTLIGLSLHQLYADAFGLKFESEDRQKYLKERLAGIEKRKDICDHAIDQYLETHPEVNKVPQYVFINFSDALNRLLTGYPAKYWREKFGLENNDQLRDMWGHPHLERIRNVETLASVYIEHEKMNAVEAVKKAVTEFRYTVWEEDQLLGKGDRKTYLRNHKRKMKQQKAG